MNVLFPLMLLIVMSSSCSRLRNVTEHDPSVLGKYERPCPELPEFVDPRDSTAYRTIQIGDQCWMKENLKWLPYLTKAEDISTVNPNYHVYGFEGSEIAEALNSTNYSHVGVLYNHPAAMSACPPGWRLPAIEDWDQLAEYIVMQYEEYDWLNAGDALKQYDSRKDINIPENAPYWISYHKSKAKNEFGYSVLPGGLVRAIKKRRWLFKQKTTLEFSEINKHGFWWSSTEHDLENAYSVNLSYRFSHFVECYESKATGFSVRCIRDDVTIETDIGGIPKSQIYSENKNNQKNVYDSNSHAPEFPDHKNAINDCEKELLRPPKYNFGFSVGFHTMELNVTPRQNFQDYGFLDISAVNGSGFYIGILGNYALTQKTSIRLMPAMIVNNDLGIEYVSYDSYLKNHFHQFGVIAEIPLSVKHTFFFMRKTRPYLFGGITYKAYLPRGNQPIDQIDSISDNSVDLGFGLQNIFSYFRLSAEIRVSLGLKNLNLNSDLSSAIDRLNSRAFMFTLLFE